MAIMDFLPQFKDNTQDVSGIPANDTMAQLELQRKLKMAQALQDAKNPEAQMISGHYVAPSWTQYAANAMNKYYGGKKEAEALKNYGEYTTAQEAKKQSGLADLLKTLKNEPTTETTMQPTQVDLQQGMNVPTSPYGTTEQVGMTSPYNTQNMQGQTNVMNPVTTQVPAKPLTQNDILGAVVKYGQTIGDNKIGEGAILDYIKQVNAPKKTTWINNGNEQVQIDETGQPTGKTLPIGVSPNTVKTLEQSGKQHDIANQFKRQELEIEKKKLNPLNLPDISASSKPLTNKKGWTLHTDAKGNQAYVSPDGKNYEEAN
jgi:hypothetical protein